MTVGNFARLSATTTSTAAASKIRMERRVVCSMACALASPRPASYRNRGAILISNDDAAVHSGSRYVQTADSRGGLEPDCRGVAWCQPVPEQQQQRRWAERRAIR